MLGLLAAYWAGCQRRAGPTRQARPTGPLPADDNRPLLTRPVPTRVDGLSCVPTRRSRLSRIETIAFGPYGVLTGDQPLTGLTVVPRVFRNDHQNHRLFFVTQKAYRTDFRLGPDGGIAVTERVRTGVSLSGAPMSNTATGTSPVSGTGVAGAAPATQPGAIQPGAILPPSQFGLPYRPAETIPFSTYNQLQNQRVEQNIWREYSAKRDGQSALSGRGLTPKLELPPVIDRLFGGSQVDFKPNGFVTLDFGYRYQFIDNPVLPLLQRRNGGIMFNEQININFNGKIGEKLGVLANFDTKASFNFENALKLNYKPGGGLPALGYRTGFAGYA